MPIIKSAKKQQRADVRKRVKNLKIKDFLKKAVKDFKKSPDFKKLQMAQSEIDKATKKGVMKANTASRRKAALVRAAKTAGVKVPAATAKKAVAAKPAAKTTASGKTAVKKPAAKVAAKATATKKAAVKKPAAKTAVAKKAAVKKPAAKKA
jgi:ribosomal protein S20